MRIGILADTHDQLPITQLAIETLIQHGAQTLLHCGDLSTPPIIHACSRLPCTFTFGNHDADNIPELIDAITQTNAACLPDGGILLLAGKKVALTHGHIGIKALLSQHPDYLIHGHSHLVADSRVGPTRMICPGALFRAAQPTVAILDLQTDHLQILPIRPFST
jgi:uncharacterized protein